MLLRVFASLVALLPLLFQQTVTFPFLPGFGLAPCVSLVVSWMSLARTRFPQIPHPFRVLPTACVTSSAYWVLEGRMLCLLHLLHGEVGLGIFADKLDMHGLLAI